ncbi:MAG: cytochrome [Frankiales bacterium]|nr:cytochrome [Frankiales bacterium]
MTAIATDCPVTDQDLADWEFNQDPYPTMEAWRAMGPVVYNVRHDRYMVTSYRDCARVLGGVTKFNSQGSVEMFKAIFGGITMEALDSPRHNEMRGVWANDFQRDTLEAQRQLIERVVASQLDPFVQRVKSGEMVDAIPNMTRGIPTLVIAHMLGIETEMFEQFSAWSDAMGASTEGHLDPTPRGAKLVADGVAATKALNNHMAETIQKRRAAGTIGDEANDLVARMVYDPFSRSMQEQEIIASNTQLVFAGNETTAKLMASTLVALAMHPDQRRALAADRSLIPQAFEEVHRWQTLTQAIPRHACSDESDIGGIRIPNGAEVMPLQGAGNRDPQRWENADAFDIFRPQRQHLGFGFGMHVCLGLNLARLEAHIWLDQLLDKLPEYELAETIDYGRNFVLRGPVAVPVVAS